MFVPAMLSMSRDFGVSLDLVQLSIGAWLIGNGAAQLVLGPLTDRFGRKNVLLWGGGIYALTLIGCSLSLSINEFLFYRFIQGMSVASLLVAGYATIHENYGDREATTILGITGSIAFIAPMLGPLLGALLLEAFSWRAIFAALCTPTVALLLILAFIMPQKHRPSRRHNLWHSFADYAKLLREYTYVFLTIAYGCQLGCLMLWLTSSPYLLMKILGWNEKTYSLGHLLIFIVLALGALISRILSKKLSLVSLALYGQSLMVLGAVFFLIAAWLNPSAKILIGALLPLSAGYGLMSSPLVRSAINACKLDLGLIIAGFFLSIDLIAGSASLVIAAMTDSALKLAIFLLSLSSLGLFSSILAQHAHKGKKHV
jgi:MFS family permease